MAEPPPPIGLFSPDWIAAVTIGVASSFVAGLQANVKGWGLMTTAVAAAVVTSVTVPIAQGRGYTWGDWLGVVAIMSGVLAGVVFLLIALLGQRALARGNRIADRVLDRVIPPDTEDR
jgi:hypothetical protein